MNRTTTTGGAAVLAACLVSLAIAAPEGAGAGAGGGSVGQDEVQDLREEMHAMEARHRAEMDALRAEFEPRDGAPAGDLSAEIDDLLDRMDDLEANVSAGPRSRGNVRLIDISLNALVATGGSTEDDDTIAALNAGGHDPNRRGFTVQNVELVVKGAVDPYFTAQANIVYAIDRDGESVVELEEAYAQTSSLPWGLQAKVGQFFTAFGRHNPQHPHQWEFVDMPFGWTRLFGPDGLRGAGAQLSWLLPTESPIEILGAVQNANGETMSSFIGAGGAASEPDPAGDFTFGRQRSREVRSLDDLAWSGRATASLDVSDEWTILGGASIAYGPNAAGSRAQTWIRGLDLTSRWKPLDNRRGFPFLDARFEYVERRYEYDAFKNDAGTLFRSGELDDSSWYVQSVWGFATDWTAGARYEDFSGDAPAATLGLEDRTRWSAAITHYFTEFSKVRVQLNRDDSDIIGTATSIWLQFEFNLGSHGAHKF